MKTTVSTLLASLLFASALPGTAFGEPNRLETEDYLNLLRIDLRASKVEVVADSMELTTAEADVFWPIYREYDAELGKLNADRISMLREFAEHYAAINEEKAREFSRRNFDYMRGRLDLVEKFARKFDKNLSAVVAARFSQLENRLMMLIDVQLAFDVPLIRRQSQTEFSAITP